MLHVLALLLKIVVGEQVAAFSDLVGDLEGDLETAPSSAMMVVAVVIVDEQG